MSSATGPVARESRTSRPRRAAVAALGAVIAAVLSGLVGPVERATSAQPSSLAAPSSVLEGADGVGRVRKPNIIFILTDDMASKLLRHMPNTRRLIFDRGARFTNFFTNVSLCCPARATLFTGKYAHNTGIVGNAYPDGFHGFHVGDERRRTVALALKRRAGYDTSLMGKYFNEYPFVDTRRAFGVRPTYVPPGWSDWAVPIRGQYEGVNYDLNLNGRIVHKEGRSNYLGDFLMRRAIQQIGANRDRAGMAMFLSFYGPHAPEPASPVEHNNAALQRHVSGLRYPRTPDFNEQDMSDKPAHMRQLRKIGPRGVRQIDRIYRRQVVSATSIDRYVGMLVRKLRRTDQLDRTYLVFTSDNGHHMGSHRLRVGKNFPYATDVHVPLAIRGPGIKAGTTVRNVSGNIDVAPTLADMAGVELPFRHDGESLLPLAEQRPPRSWRNYFYVARGLPFGGSSARSTTEFTRPIERRVDDAGKVKYRAVMGEHWRYIRWGTGAEELYDARDDPHQVRNVLAKKPEDRTEEEKQALLDLRHALRRLQGCDGVVACRVE